MRPALHWWMQWQSWKERERNLLKRGCHLLLLLQSQELNNPFAATLFFFFLDRPTLVTRLIISLISSTSIGQASVHLDRTRPSLMWSFWYNHLKMFEISSCLWQNLLIAVYHTWSLYCWCCVEQLPIILSRVQTEQGVITVEQGVIIVEQSKLIPFMFMLLCIQLGWQTGSCHTRAQWCYIQSLHIN